MPVVQLPIANGFYTSDSLPVSRQECVNAYPVIEEAPSLAQETLRGTPGVSEVASVGTVGCRGSHRLGDTPYFVLGTALVSIDASGDETNHGTIPGTGPVSMAENGSQLCILIPGGNGYIWNGTTLAQITDGDFTANGNPTGVVFIDGYFVFTTDTNKIIISNLNDGTAYSALDFGSVESSPDDVVAPVVLTNQLFIGGDRTFEAFSNVGGAGFPFQRINLFLQQGVVSRHAIQVTYNTFIFIGAGNNESPAVWTAAGNTTQKVSSRGIDTLLSELTSAQLEAITSWSYQQDGHFFAGFNLPNTTIVYDFSTQRWHERRSRVSIAANEWQTQSWRCVYPISAYGRIYCGDSQTGKIGLLSKDNLSEYGADIVRTFVTQPFQNNMKPFSVPSLELTLESGVGSLTDEASVEMTRSRDGGHNFEAPRVRSFGKQGEYQRRAIWRRNGQAKRYDMYRFTVSDQVKVAGIQLTAQITGGQ